MTVAALSVLGAVVVAALLPGPWRTGARVALALAGVLSPVAALALALGLWGRTEPGTWLLFLPLTFVYLAALDLRWGVSARLARRPGRPYPGK